MEGKFGNLYGWKVQVFQVGGIEHIGSATQVIQATILLIGGTLGFSGILIVLRPQDQVGLGEFFSRYIVQSLRNVRFR